MSRWVRTSTAKATHDQSEWWARGEQVKESEKCCFVVLNNMKCGDTQELNIGSQCFPLCVLLFFFAISPNAHCESRLYKLKGRKLGWFGMCVCVYSIYKHMHLISQWARMKINFRFSFRIYRFWLSFFFLRLFFSFRCSFQYETLQNENSFHCFTFAFPPKLMVLFNIFLNLHATPSILNCDV